MRGGCAKGMRVRGVCGSECESIVRIAVSKVEDECENRRKVCVKG